MNCEELMIISNDNFISIYSIGYKSMVGSPYYMNEGDTLVRSVSFQSLFISSTTEALPSTVLNYSSAFTHSFAISCLCLTIFRIYSKYVCDYEVYPFPEMII